MLLPSSSHGGIGHVHYIRLIVVVFVEMAWMGCRRRRRRLTVALAMRVTLLALWLGHAYPILRCVCLVRLVVVVFVVLVWTRCRRNGGGGRWLWAAVVMNDGCRRCQCDSD